MGWLSTIFSFFSSSISYIPILAALAFGGLWLFERSNAQDLAEANGHLAAANASQVATIAQMTTDKVISDKILNNREAELENIRKEAADSKALLNAARIKDKTLDTWLSGSLPDTVIGVLKDSNSNSGTDNQTNAPDSIAP